MDEEQNITYRCHAYGFDVRAEDFVWGPGALAFEEVSEIKYKGEGQLDEEMAKAFINKLDNEAMEEEA